MTVRAQEFTPKILLSLPRRSSAIPSADGKFALFTQSTYSFETHSKTSEIHVLDIATGQLTVLTSDAKASEPRWLGDGYEIVWLKEGENGNTSFVISDAIEVGKFYTAGTVAGPISNLKLYVIELGMIAVAVAGSASPDGSLHNPKDVSKSYSSARHYKSLFVRHWDTYVTAQRNAIFTGLLQKSNPHVTERKGRYSLLGFKNALRGTNLECPIPPFGGTDHFDIGRYGLTLVAKDPDLDPANHTKCNCYFISRADLMGLNVSEPRKVEVPHLQGAASSPVFAPDGKSVAFLQMHIDGYESDKNRIVFFHRFTEQNLKLEGIELLKSDDATNPFWDRSPSAITWSADGKSLYAQAEDNGCGCLFTIPDIASFAQHAPGRRPVQPTKITYSGYISHLAHLTSDPSDSRILLSSTSLLSPSTYTILDPTIPHPSPPPKPTSNGLSLSTSPISNPFIAPSLISSITYPSPTTSQPIQAWLVRPSTFNPSTRYPLAYLIHGGPQGAWGDQWSTRWNPAVFAEAGYVVVCPNPTGSTGFGQGFVDAIRGEWGGKPYLDLVAGIDYIDKHMPFIDMDRAVCLGASYGGYMVNWIQGQSLGRKFKALVCHDGVFSMTAQLASDEQYFPTHDLGGPLWEDGSDSKGKDKADPGQVRFDRWDPARRTAAWATPELVIHSALDYRLTIAEGLSAFNVLQGKGIESEFLSFPDENHWVLKEENALVWHRVVINWINKYVGLEQVSW